MESYFAKDGASFVGVEQIILVEGRMANVVKEYAF